MDLGSMWLHTDTFIMNWTSCDFICNSYILSHRYYKLGDECCVACTGMLLGGSIPPAVCLVPLDELHM